VKTLAVLLASLILTAQPTVAQATPIDSQALAQYIHICNVSRGAFDAYFTEVSVPPVIGGEIGRTTFADLCNLLIKLQTMNNRAEDLQNKLQGSSLTDSKWTTNLALTTAITAVAASKYYGAASPNDIAEIEDAKEQDGLRDFYNSIGSDQADVSRFQNERDASNNMDRFQMAARQRAMLSESLVCPDKSDDPNYRQIYEQQLRPLTIERERYRLKRDHYYGRLKEIGPTFLRDNAYEKYNTQLQNLHDVGVIIKVVNEDKPADRFTKSPGIEDGADAVVKKESTKITVQKFYSNADTKQFDSFKTDWSRRWKDYVDTAADVLDVTADIADSCIGQPNTPARTDWLNPDDINALNSWQTGCMNSLLKKPTTPPAFIFEEVIDRYKDNSIKYAALQAQVWTKESELLKKQIVYDNRQTAGVKLTDPPNCSDPPLSDAELMLVKVKMLAVENQYKEIIATERLKDSMVAEEEIRRQRDQAEKRRIQQQVIKDSVDLGGSI
jgi:hypothetical protein